MKAKEKSKWDKYKDELNSLFSNSSFDYLRRMDYFPQPDKKGDYDTSLNKIHKHWNKLTTEVKAEILMNCDSLSEEKLLNIIETDLYYFQ